MHKRKNMAEFADFGTKWAIIKTGGKQYKVKEGDSLKVEKLGGKTIEFDNLLNGGKVKATILKEFKAPKVRIVKFHPKKRYKRNRGHRQLISLIKIGKIE